MVGKDVAVGLEELGALVAEFGGGEVHDGTPTVKDLVHRLAVVRRAGVRANRLRGGDHAATDKLDPRVRHAVLGAEDADLVRGPGIPAVGVSEDEDGVALAPGIDVVRHLLKVAVARGEVARRGAGVGVQVVDVHPYAVVDVDAHKSEALGGEAVGARVVGARVPLGAGEVDPVKVGHRVQAGSDGGSARSRGAEGVGVGLVDVGMVVEILSQRLLD